MKALKLLKVFFTTMFLFFVLVVGSLVYVSGQSDIYGWRMLIVKSGSMEPTIKTGSVIFIKQQEKYAKDDVVTFGSKEDANTLITHRIIDVKSENDEETLITKGDFNQIPDKDTIKQDNIVGKYHFGIPYIGHLIAFAKTQVGVILLVVIPGTIIIYDELQNIRKVVIEYFSTSKKRKEDHKKEEDSESSSE